MNDDVLVAFVLANPGVAALVGQRGYPYGNLPQATTGQPSAAMPAFVVSGVDEASHHSAGNGGRPVLSEFRAGRWQVDIYAETGADAYRLSETIRVALDGYQGPMSGIQIGGVWGRLATPTLIDTEVNLYRRTLDFEIHVTGC
jgi:hypothetical protein